MYVWGQLCRDNIIIEFFKASRRKVLFSAKFDERPPDWTLPFKTGMDHFDETMHLLFVSPRSCIVHSRGRTGSYLHLDKRSQLWKYRNGSSITWSNISWSNFKAVNKCEKKIWLEALYLMDWILNRKGSVLFATYFVKLGDFIIKLLQDSWSWCMCRSSSRS